MRAERFSIVIGLDERARNIKCEGKWANVMRIEEIKVSNPAPFSATEQQ
jgi:hypothetical protein